MYKEEIVSIITHPGNADQRFVQAIDYFVDYATEIWLKEANNIYIRGNEGTSKVNNDVSS
jgi:cellobiose-specific phosphotransferase system component IIA